MAHTIGDLRKKVEASDADYEAKEKAVAAANEEFKAAGDARTADRAAFAAGLQKSGDYFHLNGDGTAVAFFLSPTAPDGYYSELLKSEDTPIDDEPAPPEPAPPVDPNAPPVDPNAPVDPANPDQPVVEPPNPDQPTPNPDQPI